MATHKEIGFEDDICTRLAAQGWLYVRIPRHHGQLFHAKVGGGFDRQFH